jgi:hypothetical protein
LTQAKELADYHTNFMMVYHVYVVPQNKIFNEFSSGNLISAPSWDFVRMFYNALTVIHH